MFSIWKMMFGFLWRFQLVVLHWLTAGRSPTSIQIRLVWKYMISQASVWLIHLNQPFDWLKVPPSWYQYKNPFKCPPVGDWKGNKNVNLKCGRPKKNFCKDANCNPDQECYNLLEKSTCFNRAPLDQNEVAPCAKFMLNDQLCVLGDTNRDATHVYICGNSIVGFWKSRGWFHTHSRDALR